MLERETALSQGQLAEGVAALVKAAILAADRIGPESFAFWTRSGEALEHALIEKLSEKTSPCTYTVSVDYDRNVADAVTNDRYDYPEITEKHFPTSRKGKADVEIVLIYLGRSAKTKDVLAELDKSGLRPAELHELLALDANHHDLQIQFPIVALESVWQTFGLRNVAYLHRGLHLRYVEDDWDDFYRFAAVRK